MRMLFSSRISASCCTAARRATRGDRLKAFGSSPMVDAMAYSVRLAHLDGHLNMHLHPMVLRILRELAPRYDIRAMRLSREDVGAALRYDRATSRASSGRASSSAPSPPTRRRVSARPASRPPTASTACTRPGTSTSATCLR
ncbi:MAG: ChbG/HpnK family deacetylase [Deltaproteobacteria bacterium]|nr:MAG: ChbG/HpnK family deacetylase [Deltaproteobacteria bacterium]